jgi:hypothetical protein
MKITPKSNPGKPGRKPKPPGELHGERIVVKVLPSELARFTLAAKSKGKAVSTWLRDLGLAESE